MKTKIFYLTTKITVAVILVLVLVLKVSANETPVIKFVPFSAENAVISLEKEALTSGELTIEPATGGEVLYRENFSEGNSYSKMFGFKNLKDGDYKITVKDENGATSTFFTVKEKRFVNNDTLEIKPFISVENDVVKISYLNHTLKNVEFTLENEEGIIYNKSLGNEFNISAGFDIRKLEKGDYAINISNGDKKYSYTFNK
jgi:hypothetical protein